MLSEGRVVPYECTSSLAASLIPVVEIVDLTMVGILNTSEIGGEEICVLGLVEKASPQRGEESSMVGSMEGGINKSRRNMSVRCQSLTLDSS